MHLCFLLSNYLKGTQISEQLLPSGILDLQNSLPAEAMQKPALHNDGFISLYTTKEP